jgi:DNA-binding MarR family transcriptional regulator
VSAAEAIRGFPFEGLALLAGSGRVALSRDVLADHLRVCEVAQLEAFELTLALAVERAATAFRAQEGWVDGVRAGLVSLLEFFDEEPALARYLVVYSAQAGPSVHARRGEVLEQAAALLDDERAPVRTYPPPLTAHAVASGVLGVLHTQLSRPDPGALVDLAGPLMSFTVLPFLGARAARREACGPADVRTSAARVSVELLQDPGRRLNHHREIETLNALAVQPGLNNVEVALRAGVKDQGQISRLLARLQRRGLIESTRSPSGTAGPKAWRLTTAGEQLEAAVRRETHASGSGKVADLPEELAGRLDRCTAHLLRVIGEQPRLTSKELAVRMGIEDPAQISEMLAHMAGLGLVESTREAHSRGAPKAWQITDAGWKLDRAIGQEAPAPPRSLARDLMWESGGRLSEAAVSVLTVCAAEPSLSNSEIALRVGIGNPNSMSQLLARLARRGLVENARVGGRHNVWRLTSNGETLEKAIRDEARAPVGRRVALGSLDDHSGRLNHRVVSVLELIAAEPGLSNFEIGHQLGVESKGHVSRLLTRLMRFGLIENQVLNPVPFQANAWRLTRSGRKLGEAIPLDWRTSAPGGLRPVTGTTTEEGS